MKEKGYRNNERIDYIINLLLNKTKNHVARQNAELIHTFSMFCYVNDTEFYKRGEKKYMVVFPTTAGDKRQIHSISGDDTEMLWP